MNRLSKSPSRGTLRVRKAWQRFEESLGGRAMLMEALEYSLDETAQRLLSHLEDPRADRIGLRELCGAARVSFPQLYHVYRDAVRAKAHAETILIQAGYLPRVMEAACQDALGEAGTCPDCKGAGKDRTRRQIGGRTADPGKAGSIENRKLVFESAGLVGKRAPLVDARQVNIDRLETMEEVVFWMESIMATDNTGEQVTGSQHVGLDSSKYSNEEC